MLRKALPYFDGISAVCLLIWVGATLGIHILVMPILMSSPSAINKDIICNITYYLNMTAWMTFSISLVLVKFTRSIMGIVELETIGALRLWVSAVLLALLICFTDTFIISCKFTRNIYTTSAYAYKVRNLTKQFMLIRVILATGLAMGVCALPNKSTQIIIE